MLYIPQVRFAVGAAGTKWGKTFGTTVAMVKRAWDNKDSLNWWVSPTYEQAKMAFKMVKNLLPPDSYSEYIADNRIVLLHPDGSERSTIAFKSADNADSLRGYGVNFFVMDEAARCDYDAWVSLFTTVTNTEGVGYIISTPKGRNWFYDVYQWGVKYDEDGTPLYVPNATVEDGGDPHPEFLSISMPTWANPHNKIEAIKTAKRTLPEDVFRQEYEAKFLVDSAGVFRGIKQCIRGELEAPVRGESYVMGVDLARLKDYSVLTVVNRKTKHVVHHERFNQIAWEVQYNKIIELSKKYRADVCIDSTGIGDPITEAIQRSGIRVIPYKIGSAAAKQHLIDALRVSIENQQISFPYIPILLRELAAYEYEVTPSGVIRFSAPSNMNDDCVISLALANWLANGAEFKYQYTQMRGI